MLISHKWEKLIRFGGTMTDLNGKTALVTGGWTGIGEGIGLALGKLGVKVVVCGRRLAPLEKVV